MTRKKLAPAAAYGGLFAFLPAGKALEGLTASIFIKPGGAGQRDSKKRRASGWVKKSGRPRSSANLPSGRFPQPLELSRRLSCCFI